jgi:RNase P/RNase MRP subunit p29
MTFKEHVLQHEFIGSKAQIEYGSPDNKRIINGKIIFETKNTFSIKDDLKSYVIPKKAISQLGLVVEEEICFMSGSMLIGRPEDRLTK